MRGDYTVIGGIRIEIIPNSREGEILEDDCWVLRALPNKERVSKGVIARLALELGALKKDTKRFKYMDRQLRSLIVYASSGGCWTEPERVKDYRQMVISTLDRIKNEWESKYAG